MTVHQTAPCKTEGCENPKPRKRGVRYCEPCQESYDAGRKARRKPTKPECSNCGRPKSKGGGRKLCDDCSARCDDHVRYDYKCEQCIKRQQLRSSRMTNYGLTLDEVIALEAIKHCENCGSSYRLCVDHCHKTGRVRGMLCFYCNVALGNVKDDIEILEGLITWLKER